MPIAQPHPTPKEDFRGGVFWMIICGFCFVGVTGTVRHIGSDVPPIQASFIRYLFGLIFVLPSLWLLWRHWRIDPQTTPLDRQTLQLFGWRSLVHGCGVMLWFFAMASVPMAEVTALGYTNPLYVTIGAALFLGESIRIRRVVAILVGLVGVMVILRPGFQAIGLGQAAQLLAAPMFAISFILAKKLTLRATSVQIVAMLSLGCTLVLLPGAIWQWVTPSWFEIFWLAVTAVLATFGHFALTKAFELAPITALQPITFLQLVWAAIMGVVIFGEALDPYVIAGGAIIVAAAWYIAVREARTKDSS